MTRLYLHGFEAPEAPTLPSFSGPRTTRAHRTQRVKVKEEANKQVRGRAPHLAQVSPGMLSG